MPCEQIHGIRAQPSVGKRARRRRRELGEPLVDRHEDFSATVNAPVERVFELLDDQTRLSAHMNKRSWRMGWGKMDTVLDDRKGRAVGSHIVLRGRVFGLRLYLDEVITARVAPSSKSWETVGEPRLLVIGPYSMGFELEPQGVRTRLLVYIDYRLPTKGIARLFGAVLGRLYATWCTHRMVSDAQHAFAGA